MSSSALKVLRRILLRKLPSETLEKQIVTSVVQFFPTVSSPESRAIIISLACTFHYLVANLTPDLLRMSLSTFKDEVSYKN